MQSVKRRKVSPGDCWMEKMSACNNQTSFRLVSWNLAGLAEDTLEPFLACTSLTMRWHVLLLQETFRKLEGLETEGCQIFTPGNIPGRATVVGDVLPSL